MGFLHILKKFLITFATVYKQNIDMNITSIMSSNGNTKNWMEKFFI